MSATAINNGGPAFPIPGADYTEDCGDFQREAYHGPQQGMTLRDYFAAHAPAMPPGLREVAKLAEKRDGRDTADYGAVAHWEAAWRWSYADAMLKARQS